MLKSIDIQISSHFSPHGNDDLMSRPLIESGRCVASRSAAQILSLSKGSLPPQRSRALEAGTPGVKHSSSMHDSTSYFFEIVGFVGITNALRARQLCTSSPLRGRRPFRFRRVPLCGTCSVQAPLQPITDLAFRSVCFECIRVLTGCQQGKT